MPTNPMTDARLEENAGYNRGLAEAVQEIRKRLTYDGYQHPLFTWHDVEELVDDLRNRHRAASLPATSPETPKNCSICGDPTEFCCADCRIDKAENVYVCGKTECRDAHEAAGKCSRGSHPFHSRERR